MRGAPFDCLAAFPFSQKTYWLEADVFPDTYALQCALRVMPC
jgi:hypothetical protein